jgi:hypothetical protein
VFVLQVFLFMPGNLEKDTSILAENVIINNTIHSCRRRTKIQLFQLDLATSQLVIEERIIIHNLDPQTVKIKRNKQTIRVDRMERFFSGGGKTRQSKKDKWTEFQVNG